jgi:transcriptional regulator with GAF, ATPase, and Fis domain
LRKDGTEIWVSLNSRAVRGPDGQTAYYDGFIEDITDRRKNEESLRAAYVEIQALKERLEAENLYLRSEIRTVAGYEEIIGQGEAIRQVVGQAEQVAPTDSTVLIQGQTGTGKELLAHVIHMRSPRNGKPFVTVNLASLPSSLLEGELFGREKGAYTGAMTRQTGRFEVADGGTIFLDEIGEMPLETQAKLLRVLQQGEFERLGSTLTFKVNVRIIAATNRDLASEVQSGHFREDLFYRLNVFPIRMPPLSERREDIPLLAWSFVKEFGERMGKRIERISRRSMETLQAYSWPGNVRELRNVIERSIILTSGVDLQLAMPETPAGAPPTSSLADADRQHILSVLEMTDWRVSGKGGAAERLGLKPSTLESKMKKLGIRRAP